MGRALVDAGVDHGALASDHNRLQNMGREYADLATEAGLAAAGALPPPFGTAADAASLGRSLWRGDWGGALLDAVGFIPVIGDGVKGAKIADRLNTLRKSIDTLTSGVARGFNKTRDTALKHWDDVVKGNDAAYRRALAECSGSRACLEAAATKKGPQYGFTPTQNLGDWHPPTGRGDGIFTPHNGGAPITYKNGFPDYSSHSVADVDIPMTGNRDIDNDLADQAMRAFDSNWEKPRRHTWHHHEDGVTMQLVPNSIHGVGSGAKSPHMGGAALFGGGSQSGAF